MKYGVILARFQPIHLALIKKACSENDKVLLLVLINKRNPIKVRIKLLETALEDEGLLSRCIIQPLNDLTDNSQVYLYANIVSIIKESHFNIYYSDGYEIITTWFPKFMLKGYISMTLMAREQVEEGISATVVRDALRSNLSLEGLVPKCVIDARFYLTEFILLHESTHN